jgi:hypothetical protein
MPFRATGCSSKILLSSSKMITFARFFQAWVFPLPEKLFFHGAWAHHSISNGKRSPGTDMTGSQTGGPAPQQLPKPGYLAFFYTF